MHGCYNSNTSQAMLGRRRIRSLRSEEVRRTFPGSKLYNRDRYEDYDPTRSD